MDGCVQRAAGESGPAVPWSGCAEAGHCRKGRACGGGLLGTGQDQGSESVGACVDAPHKRSCAVCHERITCEAACARFGGALGANPVPAKEKRGPVSPRRCRHDRFGSVELHAACIIGDCCGPIGEDALDPDFFVQGVQHGEIIRVGVDGVLDGLEIPAAAGCQRA